MKNHKKVNPVLISLVFAFLQSTAHSAENSYSISKSLRPLSTFLKVNKQVIAKKSGCIPEGDGCDHGPGDDCCPGLSCIDDGSGIVACRK